MIGLEVVLACVGALLVTNTILLVREQNRARRERRYFMEIMLRVLGSLDGPCKR